MKKIFLLIAFVFGALMMQAQSSQDIDKMTAKEMEKLTKIVTYSQKNLVFNKNQETKLERVLRKKATEILELKMKGTMKGDYLKQFVAIEDKYEPQVLALLSAPQKISYQKNNKKQIRVSKDQ